MQLQSIQTTIFMVLLTARFLASPGYAVEYMFTAEVNGVSLEGQPIAWTKEQLFLYGRDGQLIEVHPKDLKKARKTSPFFVPYSNQELKNQLHTEFGNRFEITTSAHFIFVHSVGQKKRWPRDSEQLYTAFYTYFHVRHIQLHKSKTPMIVIIFPNERSYLSYCKKESQLIVPGTLGHYSPKTNRVYLFDTSESRFAKVNSTDSTVTHELTHQIAYNRGLHIRFGAQPRWLVEGLAMMFESPALWQGQSTAKIELRINSQRLANFKTYYPNYREGWIARFIASDQPFRGDSVKAYANAWGLSFYLSETRPREYAAYLKRVASRKPFATYPANERLADFYRAFGKETEVLERQLKQFYKPL